jgi:hypothetical protein
MQWLMGIESVMASFRKPAVPRWLRFRCRTPCEGRTSVSTIKLAPSGPHGRSWRARSSAGAASTQILRLCSIALLRAWTGRRRTRVRGAQRGARSGPLDSTLADMLSQHSGRVHEEQGRYSTVVQLLRRSPPVANISSRTGLARQVAGTGKRSHNSATSPTLGSARSSCSQGRRRSIR